MKYRLCIFDLDGTLVDSRPAIFAALQDTARELGIADAAAQSRSIHIGLPLTEILRQLGFQDIDRARAVYRTYYYRYITREKPFPGMQDLLKKIHNKTRLAIATNKSFDGTQATLRNTGLLAYFDVLETIDKGVPKPDKDAFVRICAFYQRQGNALKPQDCLMVGDSPIDVQFAANAGIDSALVRWGFHADGQLSVQPTYLVATPEELSGVIFGQQTR
jgi:pyrophosphatase PpaX